MLVKLESNDIGLVKAYKEKYALALTHLMLAIEALEEGDLKGDLLGYMKDETLIGLFFFSDKKVLSAHYTDPIVTKNMALLKAIKHYKPQYIKAIYPVAENLYHYMIRSLSNYKEDACVMMKCPDLKPCEALKKLSEDPHLKIVSKWSENAQSGVAFRAEVERYFGKKSTPINEISSHLKRQFENHNFLLLIYKNECIGQVIIEMESSELCLIGGLYVKPKYREYGLGSQLISLMTNEVIKREKLPVLIVKKNNKAAISIYEKLGYEWVTDYTIMTIEM